MNNHGNRKLIFTIAILLGAFASFAQSGCDPQPSGLLSWWRGESNALDQVGGNNGALTASITYAPGEVGEGFLFTSNYNAVIVGNATNLQLQNFTIEAWIRRTSSTEVSFDGVNQDALIFGFCTGGYALGLTGSGGLFLTEVGYNGLFSSASVNDENFHHIAVTKTNTTVVFYLDGVPYPAGDYGSTFFFDTPASIGGRSDLIANTFVGVIDEVSVYNRPLTTTEITNIFSAGSSGKCLTDVPTPPSITAQPTNETIYLGSTAVFSVGATGSAPLYYQWTFDATNVPGATNSTLALTNAQLVESGSYAVVVTNALDSETSSVATLTVNLIPVAITTQPTSETVYVANTASFSVAATGSGPLYYQWTFDGTNVADATNATLIFTNPQVAESGSYQVIVTNVVNSQTSLVAVLTVNPLPPCYPAPSGILSWWSGDGNALDQVGGNNGALTGGVSYAPGEVGEGFLFTSNYSGVIVGNATNLQLQNFTIEAWIRRTSATQVSFDASGDAVIFGFGVGGYALGLNGSGTLFLTDVGYNGLFSSASVTDENFHHVAITKTNTIVVFYLDGVPYPAGSYGSTFSFNTPASIGARSDLQANTFVGVIDDVSVYNRALGSSEIAGIFNASVAGKCPVPTAIITQPISEYVPIGGTASFSVGAAGSPPLSFQWTFDSTNLNGATNVTLTLTNVQLASVGTYAVTVSNAQSSVVSSNALLNILYPPEIVTSPASQVVAVGTEVTLVAAATGGPSTVQWYLGTNAITGAVSTNLNFYVLNTGIGNYSAVFSNLAGSATTTVATVTVIAGPFFNGGFESINNHATLPTNNATAIPAGSTWLTGWTVGTPLGTTDIFVNRGASGGLGAYEGAQWIDFNGENSPPGGTLSQTFLTTIGQPYTFTFAVGEVGSGNVSLAAIVTNLGGAQLGSNYCVPSPNSWSPFNLSFVATATNTTVIFKDTSASTLSADVALDDVSLVTVPVITNSPTNLTVLLGNAATFTAGASGSTNVLWYQGTSPILNATNTTLSFTAGSGSAGNYYAVFTNIAGSSTTAVAVLTVEIPAGLALQPASVVTNIGATVTLAGLPSGTPPFNLQWTFDGTNLIGANSTNLVLTNVQPFNVGSYSLVAANSFGTNTSTNAVLTLISTVQVGSALEPGAGGAVTTLTSPVTSIPVTVPVNLLALGDENAVGFSLDYDTAALSDPVASIGSGASGGSFGANANFSGKVGVAVILSPDTTFNLGTQQVVQVTFQAGLVSTPTTTTITFGDGPTPRGISDTNANPILPVSYQNGSITILPSGLEGNVTPVGGESYLVSITDWVQEGLYVAGVDVITNAAQFQRADCAPRGTLGDGAITVEDWVQVGRYVLGLDPPTLQGGPTNAPSSPGVVSAAKSGEHQGRTGAASVLSFSPATQGTTSTMVSVDMAAVGDEAAVSFSVNFDPTALSFTGATKGSGDPNATLNTNTLNAASGSVGIALAYLTQTFTNGTQEIVKLNFNSISYSNTVPLTFGNTPTPQGDSDATANPVAATFQNTAIQVGGQSWPQLGINMVGVNGVSFSWPSSPTALQVQSTTNLGANWSDVVATPVTNNGVVTLTIPPPSTTTFYRLSQ